MKLKWIALLTVVLTTTNVFANDFAVFKIYTEFVRQASVLDGHLRDSLNFPEFLPPEKIVTDSARKYIVVNGLNGLYIIDIEAARGKKDVPYYLLSLRTLSGMAKSLTRGEFSSVDVRASENGGLTFVTSTGGGLFGMGARSGPSFDLTFEQVLDKAKSTSTYSEMKSYADITGEPLTTLFKKAYGFDPAQVVASKEKRSGEYFLPHARLDQILEFKADQKRILELLNQTNFGRENQARPELRARLAAKRAQGNCERHLSGN